MAKRTNAVGSGVGACSPPNARDPEVELVFDEGIVRTRDLSRQDGEVEVLMGAGVMNGRSEIGTEAGARWEIRVPNRLTEGIAWDVEIGGQGHHASCVEQDVEGDGGARRKFTGMRDSPNRDEAGSFHLLSLLLRRTRGDIHARSEGGAMLGGSSEPVNAVAVSDRLALTVCPRAYVQLYLQRVDGVRAEVDAQLGTALRDIARRIEREMADLRARLMAEWRAKRRHPNKPRARRAARRIG